MKKIILSLFSVGLISLGFAQQRLVLLEHFTQASCGPCASQNPALKAVLDANQGKIIAIKYQTSWPGTDPMNAANPTDVQSRVTYYNVSGVPSSRVDGNVYSGSPGGVTSTVINNRYGVASPMVVKVQYNVIDNQAPINDSMVVVAKVRALSAIPAGRILHTVAIERSIDFAVAPGSNGEKKFEYVMKKMFPNGNGTTLPAMAAGDSLSYSFKWSLVRTGGAQVYYDLGQAAAVAFVQNNTTKEVNGAGYDAPRPWLGLQMAPGEKPVKFKSGDEQVFAFQAVSKANINQIFQFKKTVTGLPAGWTTTVEIQGNTFSADTGSFPIAANAIVPVTVKVNGPNAGNLNKKYNVKIDINSKEILPGTIRTLNFTAITPSNVLLMDLPGTAATRFSSVLTAFSQANVSLTPDEAGNLDNASLTAANVKKIIFSTGASFSGLMPSDRANSFMNYLNSGGKMLVVGQDLGYDIGGAGANDEATQFFSDYLGAEYLSDGTNTAIIAQGQPEDSVIAPFMYSTISLSGTGSYPDELAVSGNAPNAKPFIKYANDNIAAIYNSGPNWKTAFVGFRMEAFGTAGAAATLRNALFGRILGWLDDNATINGTATASGPLSFCQGGSVTLNSASGTSYLWSTGVTTQSITVNASGTFYVQVTTAEGSKLSQALVVVRNTNPTIGNQPQNITKVYGENAVFSVTSTSPGVSFQWQANTGAGFSNISDGGQYSGTATNTVTVSSVTADNNGNQFRCVVSTPEGCTTQTVNAILTTVVTSVSDLSRAKLLAYPNPVNGTLHIPLKGNETRILMSDMAGKELFTIQSEKGSSGATVSVNHLKPGIYFLQTESREGKSPVQKIVVQ